MMAGKISVKSQPLIAVHDVRASSRWYCALLDAEALPEHEHRNNYDRVLCGGELVLQLHAWDIEDHPNLVDPEAGPHGHGTLIWFEVKAFDDVVCRARQMGADCVLEPFVNPAPAHREMWLRDPDGYVVVIASPDGDGQL
jgi:extradiol dioxygenase family protein